MYTYINFIEVSGSLERLSYGYFYAYLVADYTQGEMMWQPNTPTTPGKSLLIALHILPTIVCLLVLYSPWETGISQT